MRRKISLALLLFVLLAPLPGSQLPRPPEDRSGTMTAVRVGSVAARLRVGALTLVEAWDLTSADNRTGGVSGMALTAPRHFLMVTDNGQRLEFALAPGGAVRDLRIDQLPALRKGLAGKRYLDAEAVARDPRSGQYWVALEGIAQVWRFTASGKRSARLRHPALFKWPANGGPETLVRLPDGRFLALSERAFRGGKSEGVMIGGDAALKSSRYFRFLYDSGGLGSPTDAAALPDGRILILHRKLGLSPVFTASIALADPRAIKPGETLRSTPIAVINDKRLAENFEAMAAESAGEGITIWLVSDNNQNDWQRTRMLRFRIDPAALNPAKRAEPLPARPLKLDKSARD